MSEIEKTKEITRLLKKNYPGAKYYLNFSNPVELLVAAILSAQVRDEVVNRVTEKLFKKYSTAKDYANADLDQFVRDILPVSFAGNKAKHIKEACSILVEKYDGNVPKTMEELTELPGVGRKTAGAILINAFDIVVNIPCDTHCIRLANRLGWSSSKTGDGVEEDLVKLISKSEWKKLPYLLKAHGRAICTAPTPSCSKCFLFDLCPREGVNKSI